MRKITLGSAEIGEESPVYLIAEIGTAAGKSLDDAKELVKISKKTGFDCVKFQTFNTSKIVSSKASSAKHFGKSSVRDVFNDMQFPREYYSEIIKYCKSENISFLSSVFDLDSLDFLLKFDNIGFKVAAFELGDIFLLEKLAETKLPIILSTGMASIGEVEEAINLIEKKNNKNIIILHTVSSYPADSEAYNLRVIQNIKNCFGYPVGISDHTENDIVPIISTALGSCMLEKHVTLDRKGNRVDDFFSLDEKMMKSLVESVRTTEKIIGDGRKRITKQEIEISNNFSLSLVTKRRIKKGEKLSKENLEIKRCGNGIDPKHFEIVVGLKCLTEINEDTPIEWKDLIKS